MAPGPLNFQVTDAIAPLTPARATALAVAAKDLDGDGYPETVLTLYGEPSCSVPLQPIIIESSARMRLATSEFFPAGAPTNNCTPMSGSGAPRSILDGYLVANGTLRDLPPGSHLDSVSGVFTWAPAPGHFGTYRLVFIVGNDQTVIDVTIQPVG